MWTAEELFEAHFLPHYPDDARRDLARARATDANPAANPSILDQLDSIAATFVRLAPAVLDAPGLDLDGSDASVHRLGHLLTSETRDRLLGDAKDGELPPLVQVVIHGAIYVGACIVRTRG